MIDGDSESSFRLCWQLKRHTALHRGNPEDCADLVSINDLLVITTANGFKVLIFFGIYQHFLLFDFALFHFVTDLFCSIYVLYDDITISKISPALVNQGYE